MGSFYSFPMKGLLVLELNFLVSTSLPLATPYKTIDFTSSEVLTKAFFKDLFPYMCHIHFHKEVV